MSSCGIYSPPKQGDIGGLLYRLFPAHPDFPGYPSPGTSGLPGASDSPVHPAPRYIRTSRTIRSPAHPPPWNIPTSRSFRFPSTSGPLELPDFPEHPFPSTSGPLVLPDFPDYPFPSTSGLPGASVPIPPMQGDLVTLPLSAFCIQFPLPIMGVLAAEG